MTKPDGETTAAAFTHYVQQARPQLQRTAYLMCGDWQLADDLTQETIITLYRRWNALDHDIGPTAYARRVLIHHVRRSAKRAWRSREVMTAPPEAIHEPLHGIEEREVILRALARLGPRQRTIVVLRYWEDLSVEQTAEAVGCTRGTVTSQSHRALATLRALLGPIVNPTDS